MPQSCTCAYYNPNCYDSAVLKGKQHFTSDPVSSPAPPENNVNKLNPINSYFLLPSLDLATSPSLFCHDHTLSCLGSYLLSPETPAGLTQGFLVYCCVLYRVRDSSFSFGHRIERLQGKPNLKLSGKTKAVKLTCLYFQNLESMKLIF